MSLLARPSVVFAIVFGCFAVLIPRVLLPLFRPRQSLPVHHSHEHFRRPSSPPSQMLPNDNDDSYEHAPDSFQHMRMRHSNVDNQQQIPTDQTDSKSAVKFALPMYTVGIAVFFLYTCFKYWTKRNTEEHRIKNRYSSNNIQWNAHKRKFNYHMNNRQEQGEGIDDEELYTGLDPDYVEYLRLKKQKEIEAEQVLTNEQKQMHHTLDEMKHSLSFISSKLGTNQTGNNLTSNEITQLQDRLASTEAQMCRILNALDAASNQVNKLTQNSRQTLEKKVQQDFVVEDEDDDQEGEHRHLSSRSQSESEDEEENSNSDENSLPLEEQRNLVDEEESSSSYEEEEDDEVPMEEDRSESSSSERYGLMTTNYECDPSTIDDYEIDTIKKPDETTDSQTKVHEWHQRNHSQSLSSHSSNEQDQSIPNDEQKLNQN